MKYVKPRHARYFQLIHEMPSAKLLFHTCGSVASIIEDLIDIGVDIVNPVQVTAGGMNHRSLEKRFASRVAFWGAVDTQHLLPRGPATEVEEAVATLTRELGDGGGYVLSAVHNI